MRQGNVGNRTVMNVAPLGEDGLRATCMSLQDVNVCIQESQQLIPNSKAALNTKIALISHRPQALLLHGQGPF